MVQYKRDFFVRIVKTRMLQENRKAIEILNEYTKLTVEEKQEILNTI